MTAPESLYLLTGASRGLGLAMAQQLLTAGHTLLCLSRQPNPHLPPLAQSHGATLVQWPVDLADSPAIAARVSDWLAAFAPTRFAHATLINNAGVIPHIAPLRDIPPADVSHALHVGLHAPMHLSAAFLHATRGWHGTRRVLNLSSGLGRRPLAAQATYCAAKAGLDHFTRCLALEEAHQPNAAKVCALAPGVIDTDMQVQLRSANPTAFPDRNRFEQLKTQGQLTPPDEAARRVLAFLARPDFGQNPVADVREVE